MRHSGIRSKTVGFTSHVVQECGDWIGLRRKARGKHYCPNTLKMPPQCNWAKIEHFVSKRAQWRWFFGDERIRSLDLDQELRLDPADFIDLEAKKEELLGLETRPMINMSLKGDGLLYIKSRKSNYIALIWGISLQANPSFYRKVLLLRSSNLKAISEKQISELAEKKPMLIRDMRLEFMINSLKDHQLPKNWRLCSVAGSLGVFLGRRVEIFRKFFAASKTDGNSGILASALFRSIRWTLRNESKKLKANTSGWSQLKIWLEGFISIPKANLLKGSFWNLGYRNTGDKHTRSFCKGFWDIESFAVATSEELLEINGRSGLETSVTSIMIFFAARKPIKSYRDSVKQLMACIFGGWWIQAAGFGKCHCREKG